MLAEVAAKSTILSISQGHLESYFPLNTNKEIEMTDFFLSLTVNARICAFGS